MKHVIKFINKLKVMFILRENIVMILRKKNSVGGRNITSEFLGSIRVFGSY